MRSLIIILLLTVSSCAGLKTRDQHLASKTWECPRGSYKKISYFVEKCQKSYIERLQCEDLGSKIYCKQVR